MADLTKPSECAAFIAEWQKHYGCARGEEFRARMGRVAAEQRANVRSAKRAGRNTEDYERAVKMIELAASNQEGA